MKITFCNEARLPAIIEREHPIESSPELLLQLIGEQRDLLRSLLNCHGAALLRGFDVQGVPGFSAFAEALAPPLSYAGGDAVRNRIHRMVYESSILPANEELSPHNEKAYSTLHPTTLLFYCIRAAESGGETSLVDGRKLLARLSDRIVQALETRHVTYIQNLRPTVGPWKSWQETFETHDKAWVDQFLRKIGSQFQWRRDGSLHIEETVEAVRTHPQTRERVLFCAADRWHVSHLGPDVPQEELLAGRKLSDLYHHATFGDGTEIPDEMVRTIRRAIHSGKETFAWNQGDILIIDNLLALHGRARFTGARELAVAMC